MIRSKLDKEFLARHLFSIAVFAILGSWFGIDAFVRYPETPARELYATIEKAPPPESMSAADLEAFKAQKTSTQRILAALVLAAGAAASLHLAKTAMFRFEFDEEGFSAGGEKRAWRDVEKADFSKWDSKRIFKIEAKGLSATLDAWHHTGVEEAKTFCEKALSAGKETA